jgi:opacity protein-like surface antigen
MKHMFLIAILLLAGCASGSSIVVGEVREEIDPNQVELFLEIPETYEVIGIVTASSDAGWNEQGSIDYAVEELMNQAAKLGANGVLIESTGTQNSTVVGGYGTGFIYAVPVTAKSVTGKAIYVSQ